MSLTKTDIAQRIKCLVEKQSGGHIRADTLTDGSRLYDDCGLDSIQIVEFLIDLERDFGICGSFLGAEDDMPETIGDLVAAVVPIVRDRATPDIGGSP